MTTFTSKEQLTRQMKIQITGSDAQALKALKRIYEFQTAQEKKIGDTCEYNGVGFNGHDAKVLSDMAQLSLRGVVLSEKQMKLIKARIGKYAGQLVNLSIKKGLIRKEGNNYVW